MKKVLILLCLLFLLPINVFAQNSKEIKENEVAINAPDTPVSSEDNLDKQGVTNEPVKDTPALAEDIISDEALEIEDNDISPLQSEEVSNNASKKNSNKLIFTLIGAILILVIALFIKKRKFTE